MQELRKRKKGIKNIEHQYVERIKSASSPTRKAAAAVDKFRMIRVRDNSKNKVSSTLFSPEKALRGSLTTSKNQLTLLE